LFQNSAEAFDEQLRQGHYNELRVALFFMLRGYHTRIRFDGSSFDLSIVRMGTDKTMGPEKTVEVKWDKRAGQSSRLYFEVLNTRQKRPSGVAATTADLWCHVLGDGATALIVPVSELRTFLEAGNFREVQTSGADSNSRGCLVPVASLPASFRRVHLPTVEEYFGLLVKQALKA
jgi:hypothetical protein